MRRSRATELVWSVLLAAALAGCSGGGNGDEDAGQDDGGDDPACGTVQCTSAEQCVMDAVCVRKPGQAANACEEHEDIFEEVGPADLTCHNLEPCTADDDCPQDASGTQLVCRGGFCGVAAPEGPDTVTFRGCVDAFGIGDVTDTMKVALYRADRDPTGTPQWEAETFKDETGCEYWGAFEIQDVPTNTPLILKTYDDLENFVVTYKYNLILWADLAQDEGGGNWVFDTRSTVADPRTGEDISLNPWRGYAISQSTFNVILMAVGITDLPEGAGGIAGTVRDCAYREVQHASCGFVDRPEVRTYFTNAESPRPDDSIDTSNVNGIYAAIDLPEGEHIMSCVAQDENGDNIPLGQYPVRVFEGGITILSFDWYPGVE